MMNANSFGRCFNITLFGESHGQGVGVVVQGCPAGLNIDEKAIQYDLNRRKPGQSHITTQRQEKDMFEFQSGVTNGKSTGAPICMFIKNEDMHSKDYDKFRKTPRPSQVDLPALLRFGDSVDLRGSGIFSGRITAGIVMAGTIAKMILHQLGIEIGAYVSQIGSVHDPNDYSVNEIHQCIETNLVRTVNSDFAKKMLDTIEDVRTHLDSIGGTITIRCENFPAGIGDPWFHALESDLAAAMLSIPATRGIEFGDGFKAVTMKGSEHNDMFIWENNNVTTKTNHCGGIVGGISLGTPIVFRVPIKPTASISQPQETLNLETKTLEKLQIEGRHDPCIVPRAVVVIEAMTAIVLADHILSSGSYSIPKKK